ncbi:uncharacterized protein BXZ73DRAFT_26861, partial [Epithele typhae]|uniref:uncharacterized protein n=1 Tax=Epithele typhae TaxID=378194 RepID=UPI0020073F94
SRSFGLVLDAITSQGFQTAYMKLPAGDSVPPRIANDPKLFPFFKDCIGAIDGTHIPVCPPSLTR